MYYSGIGMFATFHRLLFVNKFCVFSCIHKSKAANFATVIDVENEGANAVSLNPPIL